MCVLVGCVSDSSHAPVARIEATPRAIPFHDSFQTDVVLDGSASADPIDDPDGTLPLKYQWEIVGDEARVQSGSMTSSKLTVRLLGDHPATVRLTVTDADGDESTARLQTQVTVGP
jgi:hypothetical protein